MQKFIGRLVRFIIKLVLVVFGLVFTVSLLLAAIVVLVVSLLKSLITGKKPAPVMMFSKFQKFTPGSMWPGAAKAQKTNDVVDVEVRKVQTGHPQLKSNRQLP